MTVTDPKTAAKQRREKASVTATTGKPEVQEGDQPTAGEPGPIDHMPDNFPDAAKAAVNAALQAAPAGPAPTPSKPALVPGLPEAPLSLNFRIAGPAALDMQLTVRAHSVKSLITLYFDVMENFLPQTQEYGYRFPGQAYDADEQEPEFSQPNSFPRPPAQQQQVPPPAPQQVPPPAPPPAQSWAPPQYHAPDAAAPQQWAQPAYPPQPGYPPAQVPPQQAAPKQKGSFMLVRLVMASTRNGAPQLQAFGPNGEKATTGLKAEILAKKCECLGFQVQHFQMINVELYNVAQPGAPRVICNWSQKSDSKYMDFEGLQLSQ